MKKVMIFVCVVIAIIANHVLTRGVCQLYDDVTMDCISFGITFGTLVRVLFIDVAIIVIGIIAWHRK